jgi:hypothetical protein
VLSKASQSDALLVDEDLGLFEGGEVPAFLRYAIVD